MLRKERLKIIMREINLHNKVLSTDLADILKVSDDTVRRDLKELVDSGEILKVHGGAISKSFVPPFFSTNNVYAQDLKQEIASKTLKLLKNDMVVVTEGGTTIIELAKMIPDNLRITFFTISPQVAITLSEHSNLDVITIGGKLSKNANLHIGASVINELASLKVDLCLLGANAFSIHDGLTDIDWEVVQVKKALIRCANKVAVLSISEKLNTSQRIKICDSSQVNYLVTELSPDSPALAPYKRDELKLI
ncbi:DeoR/GlpR family DNA-binding transcription regulator [Paradesertivirga mongoliensis]|uniref:DeoR/GlpR family DNA-binding transcription regulator n=1 Tax=Paradesertivirga mongoliensis TaxID=2100740 RepID=A0ABW4ZSK9_9SPHI|nr:DeoR/GlpR family DNA-binding transcription regulator [Pedobacter mongoliensis]